MELREEVGTVKHSYGIWYWIYTEDSPIEKDCSVWIMISDLEFIFFYSKTCIAFQCKMVILSSWKKSYSCNMKCREVKVPKAVSAFSDDVDSIKASAQNCTVWKAFLKVTAAHPDSCHLSNCKGTSTWDVWSYGAEMSRKGQILPLFSLEYMCTYTRSYFNWSTMRKCLTHVFSTYSCTKHSSQMGKCKIEPL